MKKAITLTVALLLCIIICSACGKSAKKSAAPTFSPANQEYMQEIKNSMNESRAQRSGDTYCKRCDKYIEGKVRICPYCGQYIN